MAGTRDWSQLNPDLLHSISETLTDITDHLHFRSVCSTWRAAAVPTPPHPRHLPWLLLMPFPRSSPSPCHVITPLDRRIYTLRTPFSPNHYYFGSPFGLLLVFNAIENHISVVDPLPGGRWSTLQLPLSTDHQSSFFQGKILSIDPDLVVTVLVHMDAQLLVPFLWRRGDHEWTQMLHETDHDDNDILVNDVALHEGKFFVVDDYMTYVVNSSNFRRIHKFPCPETVDEDVGESKYLAESSSGDLLMVIMYNISHCTSVKVFRMVENMWEMTKNIGEDTLFLDQCILTCFPSGRFPGYMKNCVYVPEGMKMNIYDIEKSEVIEYFEYPTEAYEVCWVSNVQ